VVASMRGFQVYYRLMEGWNKPIPFVVRDSLLTYSGS
jgi:hypothetical protein